MNLVDLAVLLVIGVSALLGLARGLVRELLGLGSWVLAGWLAFRFGPLLIPSLRAAIGNPEIADPAAYAIAFVILLIVFSLLANLIGRLVQVSLLGGLDRTLGLLFGLLRGALVLALVYIPLALMLPPEKWPPILLTARSLPLIYQGAVWLRAQVPTEFQPRVPPPPHGLAATSDDLLHATPEGKALGPAPDHPN